MANKSPAHSPVRGCATCACFSAKFAGDPETDAGKAEIERMNHVGIDINSGVCRRFPAQQQKQRTDFCFEWRKA